MKKEILKLLSGYEVELVTGIQNADAYIKANKDRKNITQADAEKIGAVWSQLGNDRKDLVTLRRLIVSAGALQA